MHVLFTFENLPDESIRNLTALNESFLNKTNKKVLNDLKGRIFKSCAEFMVGLLNPENYFVAQLKQLFGECLGRMELQEVKPVEYRAKLYLLLLHLLIIHRCISNFVNH